MSLISMMEARLPPGFRFHPRDDELVLDYLCRKLSGGGAYGGIAMFDVDLNKCEPWDLPDEACVGGREWYFFSLHDRKYATGQRTNRATRSGYWKATGKDRPIRGRRSGGAAVVGMRKTLVFYQGRAPRGTKTEWIMHEFRVEGPAAAAAAAAAAVVAVAGRPSSPLQLQEDWVLCRVFYKSRTATTRPAAADEEAGSLSSELICLSMPMPMPHVPPVDAYLAFDDTIAGYYQQDRGLPVTTHQQPALPFNKNLSSFRDLLSSMVEGGGGEVAATKTEFHQDWSTEAAAAAAYAQAQQGGANMTSLHSQTWNPFLSSG